MSQPSAPTRPAVPVGERTPWHTLPDEELLSRLGADPERGLSDERAAALLAERGPNELQAAAKTPAWRMFLEQFNDFMIWVLMVAVVISAVEGEVPEAIAITAILLLNGVLGFFQEYRAEQAMEALKQMSAPTATVLRNGAESEVPACELVPGDVVLLESGDKVPADGRLVEVAALRVEEAALTGESVPVRKEVTVFHEPGMALGDRSNMVFAGTAVSVGRGKLVVTETGQRTEMGRIADLLAGQGEVRTPLQRELKGVGERIALLVLGIAALVFVIGIVRAWPGGSLAAALDSESFRGSLTESLLVAISLAVAAIPEGLPAIVTVALSLGVRRMAERNAIVRKLHAVETLGSTTFICSDKTGTLTKNEMTVRRLVVGVDEVIVEPDWDLEPVDRTPSADDRNLLMGIAAACNDAHYTADDHLVGDPTETALIVAHHHLAAERIRPRRIAEIPFDSERKRMTTIHQNDDGRVAFMKGAPDVVLEHCTVARIHGEAVPLDESIRTRIAEVNERLASSGFRTLGFAFRELAADESAEDATGIERDMVYVGLMGLVDPPRQEVKDAIATCHRAGIHVAMVTGDHALTARAIGADIGLLEGKEVITGRQLGEMSDDQLTETAEDVRIYARVDPEHKLRIVDALKRRGHVVAMTGDGVNDAPALKRADIGVAMGRVGTDVSREAADMVLADDNFATIVEAVRQGRAVYDNLRKVILFLLSCNISEVLVIFLTTFLSPTPALLPLQILWINLVTDGLPALALGVDPASPRIMTRPPRSADESILSRKRQLQVLWQGGLIAFGGILMYLWADYFMPGHSAARAQTMLFCVMVLAQLLHSFDFRSQTVSVWSRESLRNRWLLAAFTGSMILQLVVVYTPALQGIFSTTPLTAMDWATVVIAAVLPVTLIDLVKVALARRKPATGDV